MKALVRMPTGWCGLLLLLSVALLGADGGGSAATDIDAQIEQIMQAPPQERRVLMNRFKERLATMNRQERMEAIRQLRQTVAVRQGGTAPRGAGTQPHDHEKSHGSMPFSEPMKSPLLSPSSPMTQPPIQGGTTMTTQPPSSQPGTPMRPGGMGPKTPHRGH